MKIAVLYATKTGTTEKAAQRLAELIRAHGCEPQLVNLAKTRPDLATADAVALGGSIRIGRWHKLAKRFAKSNEAQLLAKPLALFACRCGTDDLRALLGKQIGEQLVAHAVFTDGVGGEMKLEAQKGLDRFMVAQVLKSDKVGEMKANGLLDDRLQAMADALAKGSAA